MRVSEEIDALRTMGIAPIPYLVVPRIIALAIAAPVLALAGDIAGVLGGLVVGAMSLDVHPHAYLAELRAVVTAADVWTGLIKSLVFGIAIAIIGCQQGLTTRGAASGVGRSTTTTVVACLFTLVAIDTLLTTVFRGVGV
jgi:phospholipid/cholesterol/gamma-HCH transport system permease protein